LKTDFRTQGRGGVRRPDAQSSQRATKTTLVFPSAIALDAHQLDAIDPHAFPPVKIVRESIGLA